MRPADFWLVSLREYDVITRGRIKARNAQIEARRVLNQELAHLIAFAHHKPSEIPDLTKAGGKKSAPKVFGGTEGAMMLRAHLHRLSQQ